MREVISEYTNEERKAIIKFDKMEKSFFVEFFENGEFIRSHEYHDHSIHWVEEVADNWCMKFEGIQVA
jgi:hypothetical protein